MPTEFGVIAFSVVVAVAICSLWARIQRSITTPAVTALAYTGFGVGSALLVGAVGGGFDVDGWAVIVSLAVVLGALVVTFLVVGWRINAAVVARRRQDPGGADA
jgi:hypothetical protein